MGILGKKPIRKSFYERDLTKNPHYKSSEPCFTFHHYLHSLTLYNIKKKGLCQDCIWGEFAFLMFSIFKENCFSK